MGACCSGNAHEEEERKKKQADLEQQNRAFDRQLNKAQEQDAQISKLLLLGAGESGKSTLFKQMITIYGKGFTESERMDYVKIIHSNVVMAMRTLVKESETHGPLENKEFEPDFQLMAGLYGTEPVDAKIGQAVKNLWTDGGIQKTFAARSAFQLYDSAAYYFSKVDEISTNGYVPTQDDVLRSRAPTTGIVENDFTIDGARFKMFDVGGQRNERKKWIHCFERVTAVIYVSAISEYDQTCIEDDSTNRIVESLNVFEEHTNSQWFKKTSIILFLNKRDIFAEKIKTVSMKKYLPEFEGKDNDYDAGVSWLQKEFIKRNKNPSKQIYCHVTCATDTGNVRAVFNSVKDILNKQALDDSGLGIGSKLH